MEYAAYVTNARNNSDWERLLAVSETQVFQAGDVIAQVGDANAADADGAQTQTQSPRSNIAQPFYFVKEGAVKVSRKGSRWYEIPAGEGVGILAFLYPH